MKKFLLLTLFLVGASTAQAQVTAQDLMALGVNPAVAEQIGSIADGSGIVPSNNFLPAANNTYNIGSTGTRWSNIYSAATVFASALQAGNGSAASPSVTFESDTDTGVFRKASDNLGIALAGTEKWEFTGNDFQSSQTSGGIILVSPDASCSKCTVDNADAFSCTSSAC